MQLIETLSLLASIQFTDGQWTHLKFLYFVNVLHFLLVFISFSLHFPNFFLKNKFLNKNQLQKLASIKPKHFINVTPKLTYKSIIYNCPMNLSVKM